MVTFRGSLAETIFDQIEFLYVDQVGPIGSVLIQESLNTWMADLRSKNLKASLRHIPRYLEILAQSAFYS